MKNPLKTAEAGKAVGVRNAKGEIICLWDSDNIIPESNWITKMLEPFADENIIASEPLGYKYRKQDSVVNRYTALLGMGDPLCMFLGKYDRYCGITGKWTNVPYEAIDEGNYLSIRFDEIIPTIGANGFLCDVMSWLIISRAIIYLILMCCGIYLTKIKDCVLQK